MRCGNLRPCAVVFLALFTLGFLATPEARAIDPVVGRWSWFTGDEVTLRPNRTIHASGKKVGAWETGAFKYKNHLYEYKFVWEQGADGKPHVDYLNLVNDSQRLEGVNTEGDKITGVRK
jgi:hypothetical protein